MGETHPNCIRFATTHPTSPVRFVQMREVAAEIADKKRRSSAAGAGIEIPAASRPRADSNY